MTPEKSGNERKINATVLNNSYLFILLRKIFLAYEYMKYMTRLNLINDQNKSTKSFFV